MTSLFTESSIYQNSWSTESLRKIFDEKSRIRTWLEILGVLAEVQSEFGLIPESAGHSIKEFCNRIEIDGELLHDTKEGFEQSGHSMQGFINALAKRGDEDVKNWLYYGATVQDVTDTWFSIALRDAREQFLMDINAICSIAKKSHEYTSRHNHAGTYAWTARVAHNIWIQGCGLGVRAGPSPDPVVATGQSNGRGPVMRRGWFTFIAGPLRLGSSKGILQSPRVA